VRLVNRSTSGSDRTPTRVIDLVFLTNGMLFASWVSRLPAVRSRLDASEPELGVALLGIAVGAVIAMPITGWLCHRFGIRRVLVSAMPLCAVGFQLAVIMPSIPGLAAALLVAGLAYGTWDVAMNAAAHEVERGLRRALMPRFHGMFSVGGLAGAGLGALAAAGDVPVGVHLLLTGVAVAVIALAASPRLPDRSAPAPVVVAAGGTTRPRAISPRLVLLGLLTATTTLGEGAAADWSAIFLHDHRNTSESTAAIGYAVFSSAMAIGRFSGTWLLSRISRVASLRGSGLLACASLVVLVSIDSVATGLLAMVAWGLGVALIFPAAMSAAAEHAAIPARGIATVSTIGYTGFLVGPPMVGFIAGWAGLGAGLLVVGMLSLVTFAIAPAGRPPHVQATGRPPAKATSIDATPDAATPQECGTTSA
jgi:MFS family permease